jgi:hypothetical protein
VNSSIRTNLFLIYLISLAAQKENILLLMSQLYNENARDPPNKAVFKVALLFLNSKAKI